MSNDVFSLKHVQALRESLEKCNLIPAEPFYVFLGTRMNTPEVNEVLKDILDPYGRPVKAIFQDKLPRLL